MRSAVVFFAALLTLGAAPPARREPLAQRLCEALHAFPAKRKSECCGTTASSLAAVCAAELNTSLRRAAVSLDASAIDRCAEAAARELTGCDWVTPLMPKLPEGCRGLVQGRLKAGARCRSSLECPDGQFCKGVGPGREGVCAPPGKAHTRCEVPADNLAAFARAGDDPRHPVCDGLCIKGQCLPLSPVGGACPSSAQCAAGLHCWAGRCQDRALSKLGESCTGGASCEDGANCREGRCVALKNAGEPCALPGDCRALACEKAPGASAGKCAEPCGR